MTARVTSVAGLYDPSMNTTRSLAQESRLWFSTLMCASFIFWQLPVEPTHPTLFLALVFWLAVGVAIDLWARSRAVVQPFERLERASRRTWYILALAAVAVAVAFAVFRPNDPTGSWIASVDSALDGIAVLLPGLELPRAALRAAHRPDIAAYFGAYAVFVSVLWIAGLVALGNLVGSFPTGELRRRGMIEVVARCYPPKVSFGSYVWRVVYFCQRWLLIAIAVMAPWAFWYQSVTGAGLKTRTFENAIDGPAAFAPGALIALILVPLVTYSALSIGTTLRLRRRELRATSPDRKR